MANEFKRNNAAFVALRNSPDVQAELLRRADMVANAAKSASWQNSEYKTDVQPGKSRAHARASTANREAWWSQFKGKHALLSAIDSARG